MYYELNVSKQGRHLFATDDRSLSTRRDTKNLYDLFLEKFPESEGYHIMITQYNITGKRMTPKQIEKDE